jgi:hypothetical protein
MTQDEFIRVTSNLEAFYEKALNPTQKQTWFEELKGYTVGRYVKAIQKAYKTQQYRPTLSVILDILRSTQEDGEAPTEPVPCEACKGTGYVLYKKVIGKNEYEFASLCNCPNARGKGYDGRFVADKEHRSIYYTPKAVEIFGVEVTK